MPLEIQQIQDFSKFSTTQAYDTLMASYSQTKKPMKDASRQMVSLRNLINCGYTSYQTNLAPPSDPEKLQEVQLALHALQLRLNGIYKGAQTLLVNFTNGIRYLDRPPLNQTTMQTIEVMAPEQHGLVEKAEKQRKKQLEKLRTTEGQIKAKCDYMYVEEPKLTSAIHFFDAVATQKGKPLAALYRAHLSTPLSQYNSFEKEVRAKGDSLEPMIEQVLLGTTPLEDLAAASEPETQKDTKGKPVGGDDSDTETPDTPTSSKGPSGGEIQLLESSEKIGKSVVRPATIAPSGTPPLPSRKPSPPPSVSFGIDMEDSSATSTSGGSLGRTPSKPTLVSSSTTSVAPPGIGKGKPLSTEKV